MLCPRLLLRWAGRRSMGLNRRPFQATSKLSLGQSCGRFGFAYAAPSVSSNRLGFPNDIQYSLVSAGVQGDAFEVGAVLRLAKDIQVNIELTPVELLNLEGLDGSRFDEFLAQRTLRTVGDIQAPYPLTSLSLRN